MSGFVHGTTVAHPRSRGEHLAQLSRSALAAGSSPLARGALVGFAEPAVRGGLIPARAGSTVRAGRYVGVARAHPRSRGEHAVTAPWGLTRPGSSPLARGARSAGAC